MTFEEYQKKSRETAVYPNIGSNFIYPTLGLAGEAGEVAEKIKKIIRDHEGVVKPEHRGEIKKELGDVLWYVAQISTELDLLIDDIAIANLEKLQSRKNRGQIQGSGDNR
ncbi:MAG: nucleoside triphosphate pyrophosphohydrolase family protein [Patescibacteria group bacterium]